MLTELENFGVARDADKPQQLLAQAMQRHKQLSGDKAMVTRQLRAAELAVAEATKKHASAKSELQQALTRCKAQIQQKPEAASMSPQDIDNSANNSVEVAEARAKLARADAESQRSQAELRLASNAKRTRSTPPRILLRGFAPSSTRCMRTTGK